MRCVAPVGLMNACALRLLGSNRANKLGDVLFCSVFCDVMFMAFGAFIIPKWLIKDSGHIPICFGTFLELPTNRPKMVLSTLHLLPTDFPKYKNNPRSF